jgi:hypothetical protein
VDEALEEPKEWPYEMRGYPFSFLQFNPVNDEPYGVSDVSMWIYQVLELIKVRSATLDHLKRFNRQVFMQEGNISDDEEEKYKQGITGSIIKVKDIGQIKESPFGALNPDIYNIENKIKDDLVNVSGQTPGERGGSQQTGTRTVKELMVIDDGVKNRRSEQVLKLHLEVLQGGVVANAFNGKAEVVDVDLILRDLFYASIKRGS